MVGKGERSRGRIRGGQEPAGGMGCRAGQGDRVEKSRVKIQQTSREVYRQCMGDMQSASGDAAGQGGKREA